MKAVFISYDGAWPNLCSGKLTFELNGKIYEGSYVLNSGGSVSFDSDWSETVTSGEWTVDNFNNFTEEEMKAITKMVNENIPHGCCGGCV